MFVCAIAVMGFADTAAALVGTHYGRHKIPRTRKSVEGSLAFIVVTMAVFGLCGFSGAVTVVGGSLLAAAAELVLPLGLDNLSITVVVVLWLRLSAHLL
jgi:dolichol kinase